MHPWRSEELLWQMTVFRGIPSSDPKHMEGHLSYDTVVSGRLLGGGEFGKTYLYEFKSTTRRGQVTMDIRRAIKLIKLRAHTEKDTSKGSLLADELRASAYNREASRLTYNYKGERALCVCPILEGGTEADVFSKGRQRFHWLSMPVTQDINLAEVDQIVGVFAACHVLVTNGFLHNDFHMNNVRAIDGRPIIIDFGLMRKDDSILQIQDQNVLHALTFAQVATFLDNCNTNTKCLQSPKFLKAFEIYRDGIDHVCKGVKMLPSAANPIDFARALGTHLTQMFPSLTVEVKLQLIVAQLSNVFFSKNNSCGFTTSGDPDYCKSTHTYSVADIVYSIRNLVDNTETLDTIWESIMVEP